jgi:hypothetical protein
MTSARKSADWTPFVIFLGVWHTAWGLVAYSAGLFGN